MPCTCSLEAGPDDMEEDEEAIPAVRLGNADREPSQSGGDSDAEGLAPSHSGQYDGAGLSTEGQHDALTMHAARLYARPALSLDCIQVCTTGQCTIHACQYTFVAALTDCRQGSVHSMWYVAGLVLSVESHIC